MQKILFLSVVLLFGISLYAQQLEGTYKNNTDSITFSNEEVTFCISGFGGLSSAHTGEGTLELMEDYLFIHTTDYTGDKSSVELHNNSGKDSCIVHTVSTRQYAIPGILIEARNKSGKVISSKVTGNDGKCIFTPSNKIASLSAGSLGYHSITFDHTPGKEHKVKLVQNDIIENKTVVFKLQNIDDDTISLLMLSDDFKPSKDIEKELQKLERRAQKTNKLEKRFKKVFIPYNKRI